MLLTFFFLCRRQKMSSFISLLRIGRILGFGIFSPLFWIIRPRFGVDKAKLWTRVLVELRSWARCGVLTIGRYPSDGCIPIEQIAAVPYVCLPHLCCWRAPHWRRVFGERHGGSWAPRSLDHPLPAILFTHRRQPTNAGH